MQDILDNHSLFLSAERFRVYLLACHNDEDLAKKLYDLNIDLGLAFFKRLSYFEVALRNLVHHHYSEVYGASWLRQSVKEGGMFSSESAKFKNGILEVALDGSPKSDGQIIASQSFGFYRALFDSNPYKSGGNNLLDIFGKKPKSTPTRNINRKYIFKALGEVNRIRNRIAHHEDICINKADGRHLICTSKVENDYQTMMNLLSWMGVDVKVESSSMFASQCPEFQDVVKDICLLADRVKSA